MSRQPTASQTCSRSIDMRGVQMSLGSNDSPRPPSPPGCPRIRVATSGALVIAIGIVGGCGNTTSTADGQADGSVPIPPAMASPATVVRAYVRAVNARDTQAAMSLTEPSSRERSEVSFWLQHATLTNLQIHDTHSSSSTRAEVTAEFVPNIDEDASQTGIQSGRSTFWFFSLHRPTAGTRWRVASEGSGP